MGCKISSGRALVDEGRDEEGVPGSEGERAGRARPRLFLSFFFLKFSFVLFYPFLCLAGYVVNKRKLTPPTTPLTPRQLCAHVHKNIRPSHEPPIEE